MRKSNWKIAASILLVMVICISSLLTGCNGSKEDDYSAIAGVYSSKIVMSETQSVDLYLQISEDGSFVLARDTEFASNEKGAGVLGKTDEDKDAFFYTVVNSEEVEQGEKVATYELNEDGSIQFTSPMWFGSTEPKIIGDDDSVSYPRFEKCIAFQPEEEEGVTAAITEESSEAATTQQETTEADETTQQSTTKETTAKSTTAATTKQAQQTTAATTKQAQTTAASALKEGTYTGSMTKYVDAMSSNAKYDVTVKFNGGKYDYTVKITISGEMEYSDEEHYSGTYTVSGNSISMSGNLTSGSINGSSITINGKLSSFAGSSEKLTVFM